MHNFSQNLAQSLFTFGQRKLEKGEVFLLAKAIADVLPLAPVDEENIAIFHLKHRRFVDDVIYGLNSFLYNDEEQIKTIYKLIDSLGMWRQVIAHNPPSILFSCDTNTVIDDISCLKRYVDCVYLCAVADIVDKANWTYNVFRQAATELKSNTKEA